LTLTSPTSGGRSVGKVRLRTKATEFGFGLVWRDMVMNNKFKYLGKITEKGYWPVMDINNRTGSNCRVLTEEKLEEIGAMPHNSSRKSFGERV
jgi:hypothetical protein